MIEQDVQNQVRLEASRRGWGLWRNNVGAGTLVNGSFIRWGLANDSERVNRQLKSGDLIGIRPITITPDMVGETLGQFVSLEIKHSDWKGPSNEREEAQQRWIDLINTNGGYAMFVTNPYDLI